MYPMRDWRTECSAFLDLRQMDTVLFNELEYQPVRFHKFVFECADHCDHAAQRTLASHSSVWITTAVIQASGITLWYCWPCALSSPTGHCFKLLNKHPSADVLTQWFSNLSHQVPLKYFTFYPLNLCFLKWYGIRTHNCAYDDETQIRTFICFFVQAVKIPTFFVDELM